MLPGATWTAAGVGRFQLIVNEWTLELGGHCRTGLEDNIRFDKSGSRQATPSSSRASRSSRATTAGRSRLRPRRDGFWGCA